MKIWVRYFCEIVLALSSNWTPVGTQPAEDMPHEALRKKSRPPPPTWAWIPCDRYTSISHDSWLSSWVCPR